MEDSQRGVLAKMRDALNDIRKDLLKVQAATVRSTNAPTSQTSVALDTDPNVAAPALSLIGQLTAGQRVMTLSYPPRGLLILGSFGDEFDTGWIGIDATVGYQNSWADLGAGNQVGQYRRVGNQLYLRGTITGGIYGNTIFTLPAGFIPGAVQRLLGATGYISNTGPQSAGTAHDHPFTVEATATWVRVLVSGDVDTQTIYANGILSFAGITCWLD